MAIRNILLGGTDWGDEAPTFQDVNDTNDGVIEQLPQVAENAVRTLQSNNVFVNGPNLVADEATDSDGTNNTINTGSSTAIYNSTNDSYHCAFSNSTTGDSLHDPDSFTSASNAFDGDDNTAATKTANASTVVLGQTFPSARTQQFVKVVAEMGTSAGGSPKIIKLQSYNGSTWDDVSTLASTGDVTAGIAKATYYIYVNSSIEGLRVSFESQNAQNSVGSLYSLEYNYSTGSTVIADTGTASLDGNELGFAVSVPDSSFPTNTSMTVTISDGTNSLGATTIDTIKKGVVVGNDGTLTSGTLKATFTLATTDENVTPTLPSYGINILR